MISIINYPENSIPNLSQPINPNYPKILMNDAVNEEKSFFESIYPQKELTDPMKNLILDPIKELINNDEKTFQAIPQLKQLPILYEWQQGKAPDLTYEEFKQVLAREPGLDDDLKPIFLRQYILRVVKQYYQSVSLPENYQYPKSAEIDSAIQSEDLEKIRYLLDRMTKYGVDKISNHYRTIQEIKSSQSPKDLDIISNSIINEYPDIKPNANPNQLAELSREIFSILEDKKKKLQQEAESQDKIRATFTEEDLSRNLSDQFKSAFEYLISLILEKDRQFLDKSPYFILKLAMALRRIMPVANAEVLAQIWWQLRLGGIRSKYIIDHIKKEWPEFVEKQRLERYAKHLFDNFLGSEASSFEFQNVIPIGENTTPNDIIFQIIKNLIRNHIPKDQKEIRFTLLIRDNKLLKISIPYQEGLSDKEIEERIKKSIQLNHQWKEIDLDDKERAELSYLGHNAKKRKQNRNYQTIYQSFVTDSKTNEDCNGDYLIQIGSLYKNSRDPRSLFAVNSHQTAIQIKFLEAGKITLITRYNHQYFDGMPAQRHTDSLISEISQIPETISSQIDIISRDENSQQNFIKNLVEQPKELDLPLVEARADYEDDYKYQSISLGDGAYLSPTDLRCLTMAIANEIEYYQQLFAGKKIGSFFIRDPNTDNIQPVVVATKTLKEKNTSLLEWIKQYRETVKRAREGISDVALFASIAGTKEIPLSYAGKFLNPSLLNMLTRSQGMISPLPVYTNFTTAFSDAYRPAKIDLANPVPSMGIIGMGIDKNGVSHYTVRLLPSQGQKKFKEKVEQLFADNIADKEKNKVFAGFTKIIQAWDRLLCGQGPEHQISLEDYISIRNTVVNDLVKQGLIVLPKEKTIQAYLNEALQEAAEEIFNPEKIAQAREEILEIFQNQSTTIHS